TISSASVNYTLSGATAAGTTNYGMNPTVSLNLGTTNVSYSVSDAALNSATCNYSVRVEDHTAPTITCPANQNIVATQGCSATSAAWADAGTSDNCSVTSLVGPTMISGPGPVTFSGNSGARTGVFPTGTTIVGYTATDNSSNTATCTFAVFVQENIAPLITCPAGITVSTDAATCTRTLTPNLPGLGSPSASDNCNLVSVVNSLQQTNPTISAGNSYTVTYTATDASGNTAICSQNISVVDGVKPVITCAAQPYTFVVMDGNSCVENGNSGNQAATGFNPPVPTATDNCSGTLTPFKPMGQPGQYCVNTTQYLQWKATDAAGNMSTCSQQIIIVPNVPAPTIQCPAAITVNTNAGSCVATNVNLGTPTVTPAGLVATNNASGTYPVGNTTVTWTATNAGGTTSCQQVVTVNVNPANVEICGNGIDDDCNPNTSDVCPPCTPTSATIAGCNATPVVLQDAPGCPASLTVTPATFGLSATNNCGNAVAITPASVVVNATGQPQTITFTATVGQNSVTCVKTVTVNPAAEVCDNGIDDDCDGLTDSADPDCGGGTACASVKRLASDGAQADYYGNAVDVSGDLAVVGAYYDDNPGVNSGSVYVLDRGASNTWLQVAKVVPTDGSYNAGDWFGYSVAIDGDYIVAGASEEAGTGAAYVFHKGAASSSWTQVAKLTDPTGVAGDKFGYSVSISGDFIIVGAPLDEPNANINDNYGSASIFQRNTITGVWSFVAKRVASDGSVKDYYGSSVSIDGDYAAVGSPSDDYTGKADAGSVYILSKGPGNTWSEIIHRHASDYLSFDYYGTSVSISGSYVLVGSPQDDVSGKANAGSAYLLYQDEGGLDNWGESDHLIASDFTAADQFGISVSLDGDHAAIGAQYDDMHGFHSGSTYLFDGSGGWIQTGKVDDATGAIDDNFGRAVGISGNTVIVGSWKDDNGNVMDQGSVTVFDNCSNTFQAPSDDRSEAITTAPTQVGKVLCAPNPSTDIINIDVTLAQEEAMRITVWDATGRLVETVFDGKSAPQSRYQWDGGRSGRGMYFIRVQSATVNKVVSVTILR
ncbi:MAG: HYR domain-containing protein, partial [Saprospiraceae bacterium]